ncbi:PREDICTED: thylakoid lumenal 15 kDa [Prunus dulcis]|uniref:PREDICTED: thylakoid lumenal 15 kDa n=1 Tax=Prunus dulcis TaxID=3755 RepID=A0A5E4E9L8_PRUDU|nr:PREDICTED: thylakoid lumenal 15 kDa [Prunus dulcis]
MAVLNVSLCSKLPPKPPLSSPNPHPSRQHLSLSGYPAPQVVKNHLVASRNVVLSVGDSVCKASLIALLSASLFVANPALAFKGGGPYGSEVTRGQDLSGKDFSGKTLIKQDFKTSILRQANFRGAKLLGASFFDADLTGTLLLIIFIKKNRLYRFILLMWV